MRAEDWRTGELRRRRDGEVCRIEEAGQKHSTKGRGNHARSQTAKPTSVPSLGVPACQQRRLVRSFAHSRPLTRTFRPLSHPSPGHPRHLRPTQDAACQELLIRCQGLGGGAAHLSIRGLRAQRQPTSDKRPAGLPLACKHRRFLHLHATNFEESPPVVPGQPRQNGTVGWGLEGLSKSFSG